MADDKAQKEPSVEETLASIRRIISEDGAAGELDQEGAEASGTREGAADRDAVGEDEDVLELTEMVTDDGAVVSLTETAAAEEELISEAVAGISTDAFAALAEALTRERRASDAAGLGEADRTIEQVVREELRPLLKEWLDQNLPSVVERLVKQELERMASRARDR